MIMIKCDFCEDNEAVMIYENLLNGEKQQFCHKCFNISLPKSMDDIYKFVKESNAIERIFREPTQQEIDELIRFMSLDKITIPELKRFVSVYQPNAKLRDKLGMDVRVGNYLPPRGGPHIIKCLQQQLDTYEDWNAFDIHKDYEKLHPFMDCNGRSGRAIWAWKMQDLKGGFLLNWYYQTLQNN